MPTRIKGQSVYEQNVSLREDFDQYSTVFELGLYSLEKATGLMDSLSQSYRVHVGSVVANFDEDRQQIIGYGGANYKPTHDTPKECAELASQTAAMKRVDRATRRVAGLLPVLFSVVSSSNAEEIESVIGLPLPTLPLCKVCRDTLLPNSAVVLTESVNKDPSSRSEETRVIEAHTGAELIQLGALLELPPKLRPKDISNYYPRRVLNNPSMPNFLSAHNVYKRTVKPFENRPEQSTRGLRAQFAVLALAQVMS